MRNPFRSYTHWLHTRWPAGTVERLPESGEKGVTAVPGVRIVGDLTGIPLLKFSSDSGAKALRAILDEPDFWRSDGNTDTNTPAELFDVAIIGAGVSGIAAAIEAKKAGLRFIVFEATQTFSTVVNFPKAKPIYTYPTGMTPEGGLQFSAGADVKEALLEEMETQRREHGIEPVHARIERIERGGDGILRLQHADGPVTCAQRVIIGIGRSGNYRKLGRPGEETDRVYNRLYDPKEFAGQRALVVGGGDSALETAIALASCGAHVTLSYRKMEFARPKPGNVAKLRALERDPDALVEVEHPDSERVTTAMTDGMRTQKTAGSLKLRLGTEVKKIEPDRVVLVEGKEENSLPNDVVFVMIGREAPLDFFRRSRIPIRGEWRTATWISAALFLLFCVCLYHWKSDHPQELALQRQFIEHGWFPYNVPALFDAAGAKISEWSQREGNILHTLRRGVGQPSFYYTLAYCTCVVGFGIVRIRRRRTPYVKWQTLTLMAIQCIPLFILPEILLPWMGRNGWFEPERPLRWLADHLFESYDGERGHERAYWRAYGFILAWPLFVYNVFTEHPLWLWLVISLVQTFVIIPAIIFFWGKGAYCGWICSCGALAETLGDTHRHKMPHGPGWNRLNMTGQAVLFVAFALLGLRAAAWALGPESWPARWFYTVFKGIPFLSYAWTVDLLMAGILGVGLYFWFSGRVWCRFACPLAALMHIYARFSRYRIFAEKSKCISCNICTSVCHQGIDVMNFANKGLPMEDPQCVRCSACVQQCPTGVLAFGRYGADGRIILDKLDASPVRMREERGGAASSGREPQRARS